MLSLRHTWNAYAEMSLADLEPATAGADQLSGHSQQVVKW